MAQPKKVNYLNNKDILKEIHKSKMTYCYVNLCTALQYSWYGMGAISKFDNKSDEKDRGHFYIT